MSNNRLHDTGLVGIVNLLHRHNDHFSLGFYPRIISVEPEFLGRDGQKQPDIWVMGKNVYQQALFEFKCSDARYHHAIEQLRSGADFIQSIYGVYPFLYFVHGQELYFERIG